MADWVYFFPCIFDHVEEQERWGPSVGLGIPIGVQENSAEYNNLVFFFPVIWCTPGGKMFNKASWIDF